MEHWDRLRGDQGFYWDDGLFRPSTDTFLLGGLFPSCGVGNGPATFTGTGGPALCCWPREPSLTVTGLELREDACRLARRTAQRSGWQERLLCRQGDLRLGDLPPMGGFDLVVSNPPYFPPKAGRVSAGDTECRPVGGGVYAGGCVPGRRLATAVGRALA